MHTPGARQRVTPRTQSTRNARRLLRCAASRERKALGTALRLPAHGANAAELLDFAWPLVPTSIRDRKRDVRRDYHYPQPKDLRPAVPPADAESTRAYFPRKRNPTN